MGMPDEVWARLRETMERPDFFSVERDRRRKLWSVGTYTGRMKADGSDEAVVWHEGSRLTTVLEHVRSRPVSPRSTTP